MMYVETEGVETPKEAGLLPRPFPNQLSEFVFVRTYSRWLEAEGRRETWPETVDRYVGFLAEERPNIPKNVLSFIRESILRMDVLPSMRAMWAAGEAARRDNTTLYNCFAGSEEFLTRDGVRRFSDVVGETVQVRAADGEWRQARVHAFGRQNLVDVTFGHWNGGKHGNATYTVRVTPDHRWLLLDGTETTTLKVGDKLAAPHISARDDEIPSEAIQHGFVYGDGTLTYPEVGGPGYMMVRLCGKKAQLLDTVFAGFKHSYPPSYDGDPVVYCGRDRGWKSLPTSDVSPEYVAGFLHGLALADGCGVTTSGNIKLSTQNPELVDWIRRNAPLAGFKFLSDCTYDKSTNFGARAAPLHMLLIGTGNAAVFRVESIRPVDAEEVFCVVEPVTRSFTLACGQVTGNCSFAPLDSLPAFSELLYILMMGTGVGFSVERRFTSNLPVVAAITGETVAYRVEDSTKGWADSLLFGLEHWFRGIRVAFDYSGVRPRGAVLRTKGGRASGPEPLKNLHDTCERIILGATGRRLKSIECHDIACTVGDIVHVGGVRRAALISFSDPDDEDMRHAKDWSDGKTFPSVRYMANNSAFWESRPDEDTFWTEWNALRASGSGERGFFRMPPSKRNARRGDFRCNPCVTGDTWVNTEDGPRQVRDLVDVGFTAVVDGHAYTSTEPGFWSTGVKPVFRLETEEGHSITLTRNHRVCRVVQTARMQRYEWVEAGSLCAGDLIRLNNHRPIEQDQDASSARNRDLGWLIGSLIGDGTFACPEGKSDIGQLRFWGSDAEVMANAAFNRVQTCGFSVRSDMKPHFNRANKFWQISCTALAEAAHGFGVVPAKKTITAQMEMQPDAFAAGLLSGLFDADGSVQGMQDKGVSVRLAQSNLDTLRAAQRMLLRLGVNSTLYANRREAGYRNLPDGKGGYADYWCQADHELVVAKDNLFRFAEVIGFTEPAKAAALEDLLGRYRRAPNRERFVARVAAMVPLGEAEVFDCTIPELGAFDANGLYVHNCGEIALRYSLSEEPWKGQDGGGEFCNLSAAVMRSTDTVETFAEKVRVATWIGVIQATFTHFPYLRPKWKQHCDEDRLLGVDITGHCDNPALSGDPAAMLEFNRVARETAAEASAFMGIPMPAAITCGKPSGNSSQLVDCASGFHGRHSHYYLRRVRIDGKDPLFALLRDSGVPIHKENGQEHLPDDQVSVWVAEFPVKAPDVAVFRDDETALEQLERYLHVMRTWCGERGHNQSATIYVRDHEWDEVGRWVYEHFDEITGLSFLPYDGGKYRLAPYQEITAEEYAHAAAEMPEIDFSLLAIYEREDRGQGSTELACMSGNCEV